MSVATPRNPGPAPHLAYRFADSLSTLVPVVGPWLGHDVAIPILTSRPLALGLLATALGVYLLSRLARARIAVIHSAFWRRTLPTGNVALWPSAAGVPAGRPSRPVRSRRDGRSSPESAA